MTIADPIVALSSAWCRGKRRGWLTHSFTKRLRYATPVRLTSGILALFFINNWRLPPVSDTRRFASTRLGFGCASPRKTGVAY